MRGLAARRRVWNGGVLVFVAGAAAARPTSGGLHRLGRHQVGVSAVAGSVAGGAGLAWWSFSGSSEWLWDGPLLSCSGGPSCRRLVWICLEGVDGIPQSAGAGGLPSSCWPAFALVLSCRVALLVRVGACAAAML